MGEITRVGVDLAKRVIQVHAVDATGRVIAAKRCSATGSRRGVHSYRPAVLSRWRPARDRTTGAGGCWQWAGGEADRAALRLALSAERQDRQERRSRRGGDLRGGFAPQHALRAGQERRAAKHDGAAPVARRLQGRANRLHQPDPGAAGRVRPRLRATPRSAACSVVGGRRRRQQRAGHDRAHGAAACAPALDRDSSATSPGATSASPCTCAAKSKRRRPPRCWA